jgi:hypothetical protein
VSKPVASLPFSAQVFLEPPASTGDVIVDLPLLFPHGPALVAPSPASELCLTGRCLAAVCGAFFCLQQLCPQQRHCGGPVLRLASLRLASDHDSTGAVPKLHGRGCLVSVLPAWAASPASLPIQVTVMDHYLDGARFAQDSDRHRTRMDAPALLVRRDALPSVSASLVAENGIHSLPGDLQDDHAGTVAHYRGAKDPSWQRDAHTRRAARGPGPLRRPHLLPHESRLAWPQHNMEHRT